MRLTLVFDLVLATKSDMATHKHKGHIYHGLENGDEAWEDSSGHSQQSRRFRFIIKMLYVFAAFSVLLVFAWSAVVPRNDRPYPPTSLRFTKDGTFQISVFADLHFGESTTPAEMTCGAKTC